MLNLLRVESSKLFREKTFWITVLAYVVSITATFIPLSLMDSLPDFEQHNSIMEEFEINQDLIELEEMLDALLTSDSFVQNFYESSSGQPMVVMVFVTIFIFADIRRRTIQGTLLSGYSRRQVYLAKFFTGILGCWAYYVVAMINAILIGIACYGMHLDAGMLGILFQVLLAQCMASIQYVAVFTAFAFFFSSGWAFLASTLFFLLVPGIPLLLTFFQGLDIEFATNFLPSFIGVNGVEGFVTLDMMLARPDLWTTDFVIPAALVWLALTAGSTLLGLRAFQRTQL